MERLLSLIYSLSPIKFKYENDEQGDKLYILIHNLMMEMIILHFYQLN